MSPDLRYRDVAVQAKVNKDCFDTLACCASGNEGVDLLIRHAYVTIGTSSQAKQNISAVVVTREV